MAHPSRFPLAPDKAQARCLSNCLRAWRKRTDPVDACMHEASHCMVLAALLRSAEMHRCPFLVRPASTWCLVAVDMYALSIAGVTLCVYNPGWQPLCTLSEAGSIGSHE